ncbi:MAG: GspH/FimT family pseudopilin [Candidatus Thiodiazotropha sp. 6PLUC2]
MSHPRLTSALNNRGLTLIELITTLATLTLLIALATPSLLTLTLRTEQTTSVNGFLNHFYLARSLAIQQEQHQVICPSEDGMQCLDQGNWSRGLIVFEDRDRNGILDQTDPIQGKYLIPEESKIEIHSSEYRKRVIYHGDGRPSGYNLTLTFCAPEKQIEPKALIVNNVGRIRISEQGPGGSALKCGS